MPVEVQLVDNFTNKLRQQQGRSNGAKCQQKLYLKVRPREPNGLPEIGEV